MVRLFFAFLFFVWCCGFSQQGSVSAAQISVSFFKADAYVGNDTMGFDYFIKNNSLFKQKGKENFEYKNIYLGAISRVDLQNPLRVLVFYENFNTVIALDGQLNEVDRINVTDYYPSVIVSAMGMASRDDLWLFDGASQQLSLFNLKRKSISPVGNPFKVAIKDYGSSFNYFFWVDAENRFFTCDVFGKTREMGVLPVYDRICLLDVNFLVYEKNGSLYLFDLQGASSFLIENIQKSFISFTYKNQNLAIFTAEGITNYKINLP